MPVEGHGAGGKSRGPRGAVCAAAGVLLGLVGGCTTPTVAARALWIGQVHDVDGSRTLHVYAGGEITERVLRPTAVDAGTDGQRLLVELAPGGGGALIRGVDEGWLEQLGSPTEFRAGYLDLEHARALPLVLPAERAAGNVAAFTAAGDALVWAETCPPGLAVVPLAPAAALTIDAETGAAVPLRTGGKGARAGCAPQDTPAVASAADAPVVFLVEATAYAGGSIAVPGATITALRYPRDADDGGLATLGTIALPAGHTPGLLRAVRCPGGDPGCGLAVVDPDGAGISFAIVEGPCRLLRWTVGEEETTCAIEADAAPELQADGVLAAISPAHYVLRSGASLVRYDWTTGEADSRPLVGDAGDAVIRTTLDGRGVVLVRTRGPLLRVDAAAMDLVSVVQRDCPGPQAPVLAPSGRWAAWTCTQSLGSTVDEEGEQDALATGEVVRVGPGGMDRFQGVPMWALAIDDDGDLLLHSQRINRLDEVDLGATDGRANNLYVLAADGELARISPLEPDPERLFGLAAGTSRRIAAAALVGF